MIYVVTALYQEAVSYTHLQEQPRHYESVISHVKIELPEQPMRYRCV